MLSSFRHRFYFLLLAYLFSQLRIEASLFSMENYFLTNKILDLQAGVPASMLGFKHFSETLSALHNPLVSICHEFLFLKLIDCIRLFL
jgi:hypothetical protein